MLFVLILAYCTQCLNLLQIQEEKTTFSIEARAQESNIIDLFPSVWKVLGPFQAGTREMGWDPLSSYGGWDHLSASYNGSEKLETFVSNISSELVNGGYAIWSFANTREDGKVGWDPNESLQNVRWEFNRNTFGWSSLQHSVYYKGVFTVPESGLFLASVNGVATFKIDSSVYPGNFYSYSHSSISSMYLNKGEHSIFISTQFDIRRDGAAIPPISFFSGSIRKVDLTSTFGMIYFPKDTILPDIIDNRLISQYASITLKNNIVHTDKEEIAESSMKRNKKRKSGDESTDFGWKKLIRILCFDQDGNKVDISLNVAYTIMFSPGQIHSIPFKFDDPVVESPPKSVRFEVLLTDIGSMDVFNMYIDMVELKRQDWASAQAGYKITTDGYDNTIQYAYVKPPRKDCLGFATRKCPVLLALHGAGVEVSSPAWISSVNQQDYSWVLFPSGRTEWGFDWHGPSFKNIEASLEGLLKSPGLPRDLIGKMDVLLDRLVVIGHSNGGQGAWWFCSHYPDRVLACFAASGYVKIQLYVPYYLHGGYSYADPTLRGLMESSISENDIDLYASNLAGMPILARTGSNDDNVPPMHTRKLVRLISEWSNNEAAGTIKFVEDKGKGHWYDGVLSDSIAQDFFDEHLSPTRNSNLDLPDLPNTFTISTMNPASTGPRGGISILQPLVPYRISSIHVHREGNHWILTTRNVRRFGFVRDKRQRGISSWSIDHTAFRTPPEDSGPSYLNKGNGTWELSSDLLWISRERNPTTFGPAFQVFSHPFKIVIPSSPKANLTFYRLMAESIATSWYIYSRGSAQIIKDIEVLDGVTAKYNLIVLGDPRDNEYTLARTKAGTSKLLQFRPDGGIQIRDSVYNKPGTGSLFLAPSSARTRLGLFITGVDSEGLQRAVGSIPFRSGSLVPDYTIFGPEYGDPSTGWMTGGENSMKRNQESLMTKGVGGVLAGGFWDFQWEFLGDSGNLS